VIFGYILLRSGDDLEYHEGPDLYQRGGICAAVYALSWILFEMIVGYLNIQGTFVLWIYLVPVVAMGIVSAMALFDLDFSAATAHYFVYFFAVVLLRWAIAYGWLWVALKTVGAEIITPGSGQRPPPPTPAF